MCATAIVLDDVFQRHDAGPGHPERPERLRAIVDALGNRGLTERCHCIEPVRIDPLQLRPTHEESYIHRLQDACMRGASYIDTMDSGICAESYDIALLAAGSILRAVDRVVSGEARNAFCAVRPPGHHAERDRSMGFCMFGNVALAVDYLRRAHGVQRIVILDWDVHHGNGTQHLLEEDPDALFISIHGHPDYVYPGTGYAGERGLGKGVGATLNIPMMPGAGDREYRDAFERLIRPAVDTFRPEFILVSAGFDAHRLDPLAPINLDTESFDWMTRFVLDSADEHCDGRVVSVLEGGYHLGALAESVAVHVGLLVEHSRS